MKLKTRPLAAIAALALVAGGSLALATPAFAAPVTHEVRTAHAAIVGAAAPTLTVTATAACGGSLDVSVSNYPLNPADPTNLRPNHLDVLINGVDQPSIDTDSSNAATMALFGDSYSTSFTLDPTIANTYEVIVYVPGDTTLNQDTVPVTIPACTVVTPPAPTIVTAAFTPVVATCTGLNTNTGNSADITASDSDIYFTYTYNGVAGVAPNDKLPTGHYSNSDVVPGTWVVTANEPTAGKQFSNGLQTETFASVTFPDSTTLPCAATPQTCTASTVDKSLWAPDMGDQSATFPVEADGSVKGATFTTTSAADKQDLNAPAVNIPLAGINGLGFTATNSGGAYASVHLTVLTNGSGPGSIYTQLNWESYKNGGTLSGNGTPQTFSNLENGVWWSSHSIPGDVGSSGSNQIAVPLSVIEAANPNAVIVHPGMQQGSGNAAIPPATEDVTVVSQFVFCGAVTDFTTAATPVVTPSNPTTTGGDTGAASGTLASTGGNAGPWINAGLLLFAAGLALFAVRAARRRDLLPMMMPLFTK
jgi:hypothetical protein